ncbi:hypothetical protein [Streptomyces chartreusis]
MPTLPAALWGAPFWFVALAVLVLVAVPGLVAFMGWMITRRATPNNLPQVLLGLSHVISAFCGLLPWGKPSVAPAPLQPVVPDPEPATVPTQTLVVMRNDVALQPGDRREER